MSDWLSEIELRIMDYMNAIYITGGAEALLNSGQLVVDDLERMARVIRDLVEQIKRAKAICNSTPEESEPQILDDAITEILGILESDLPPDAKELLK